MKVYIINGFGGCGKTSLEEMVRRHSTSRGYVTSMVEIVKYYAEQMGWDGGKTDADRRFLSDLKDCLTLWRDVPYQYVIEKVKEFDKIGAGYCFIDARERTDIERLKKDLSDLGYTAQSLLVDRGIERVYGNHADDGVMEISYDITIMNTGTLEELDRMAKGFVETEEI